MFYEADVIVEIAEIMCVELSSVSQRIFGIGSFIVKNKQEAQLLLGDRATRKHAKES